MAHDHEWKEFNAVTSLSLKYSKVEICTYCRTFRCTIWDGTVVEIT